MCTDNTVSDIIREGIYVDAPFPSTTHSMILEEILEMEGFQKGLDFTTVVPQSENCYTKIKYLRTTLQQGDYGETVKTRHYQISIPDRYVPSLNIPEGINPDRIIHLPGEVDRLYLRKK